MNSQHYIFVTGSIARPDEPVKTTWVTPDVIKKNQVKSRLCEAGPRRCEECQLCAFGRYYLGLNKLDAKAYPI